MSRSTRLIAHGLLVHGERLRSENEPLTLGEFWERCGVSSAQGFKLKGDLVRAGALREDDGNTRGALRFGPRAGLVLGISLGTDSMRGAVIDANGDVVAELERPSVVRRLQEAPRGEVLKEIRTLAAATLNRAFQDVHLLEDPTSRGDQRVLPLLGVALALPSPIRRTTKTMDGAVVSAEWRDGRSVECLLGESLRLPVARCHALNDANALAIGAAFDNTRMEPPEDVVRGRVLIALRVGGGLGAGTIIVERNRPVPARSRGTTADGLSDEQRKVRSNLVSGFLTSYLIEGASGFAGEFGHLPLGPDFIEGLRRPELNDVSLSWPCSCGEPGHLESLASARGLLRRLEATPGSHTDDKATKADLTKAAVLHEAIATTSDRRVLDAISDIGVLIGRALAGPILMLNPHSIVLSGALVRPELKAGIESVRSKWGHPNEPMTPLLHCLEQEKNVYAAARGAALAVLRGQLYRHLDSVFSEPEMPDGHYLPLRPTDVDRITN